MKKDQVVLMMSLCLIFSCIFLVTGNQCRSQGIYAEGCPGVCAGVTASATPSSGMEPLTVTFTAAADIPSFPQCSMENTDFSYGWYFFKDEIAVGNEVGEVVGQTVTYTFTAGNYKWLLWAGGMFCNKVDLSDGCGACMLYDSITVSPPCQLTCTTTVPSTGMTGDTIPFKATATPSGCSGNVSYDWDFGDNSSHSSSQNPTHSYAQAGTYTWTMTAKVGSTQCKKTGTITISASNTNTNLGSQYKGGLGDNTNCKFDGGDGPGG